MMVLTSSKRAGRVPMEVIDGTCRVLRPVPCDQQQGVLARLMAELDHTIDRLCSRPIRDGVRYTEQELRMVRVSSFFG